MDNGKEMVRSMVHESGGACLLLAPLGCWHLLARRASSERAVGRVLLGCLALYVAAFLPLANLPAESFFRPILARFWMQVPHPCRLACVACLHVPRRLAAL